jgi:hypothetical protein
MATDNPKAVEFYRWAAFHPDGGWLMGSTDSPNLFKEKYIAEHALKTIGLRNSAEVVRVRVRVEVVEP